MYNGNTIGAVIPTDNRAELVAAVLDDLPSFVDRAYVVDDGSTDDTWAEIRRCIDRHNDFHDGLFEERVVSIREDCSQSGGWALTTGYRRACEESIDLTVVLGGSDRIDAADLERYLAGIVDEVADLQALVAIDPEASHV